MIIVFSSDAYENITMFGDVAEHLLKIMGYSANASGTIKDHEVPQALARLKNSVDVADPEVSSAPKDTDETEPTVSLAHRAFPLIEMLEASVKEKCEVTWKVS